MIEKNIFIEKSEQTLSMSVATNYVGTFPALFCAEKTQCFFFLAKHQEISRTKNFPVLIRSWNKTWCFNKTKAQLLDGRWLQTADVSDGKLLAVTELRYVQRSPDVLSDRWYSVSTYPRFAETYMANIYSGDRVGNTLLKTLTSDCVMICNLKW